MALHREERRILGGKRKAKARAKKLQKLQQPPEEASKKSKLFNMSQKRDCRQERIFAFSFSGKREDTTRVRERVGEGETEGEREKRCEEGAMAEEALGSQACLCRGDDRRTVRPWTALPENFKKNPRPFLRSFFQVTTDHPDQSQGLILGPFSR